MKKHISTGIAQWKTRLNVEALEERSLMSASPLNWAAPAGSSTNAIYLGVVSNQIEVFDNGTLVHSQAVAGTSSITLTTATSAKNTVTIASTPSGVPTTINLKGVGDSVFVGDSGTILSRGPAPTDPAATMQNINGAVTINGILASHDSVALGDSTDTGSHKAIVNGTSVTGLAPAAINFTGISGLSVDGSTGGSTYAISAGTKQTVVTLESAADTVSVTSTTGSVSVNSKNLASASATVAGAATGVNTLTAGPGFATLSGAGYSNQVLGFISITVDSKSASDVATLEGAGGIGGNTLTASPTDAVLTAGGDRVEAVNFNHVTAYGTDGANDVATLTGAATGTNTLVARSDYVSFSGSGYSLCASGFTSTTAHSESASDTASLYGSPAGDNTLVATPTMAAIGNASFRNEVDGFSAVTAYSGYAGNVAYLIGANSGANSLVATPGSTTFSGAGYSDTATSFPSVYAYSESAGNVAYLSGAGSFLYATPTTTQLSGVTAEGSGYFVETSYFPSTYEYLTANTFELTSSGSLVEQIATLNRTAAAVARQPVSGAGLNLGSRWITVDSAFDTVAIGNLVNANYVWACDSTGVHVFGPSPSGAAVNIALTLDDLSNASIQSTLFRDMVRDGALTYNGMLDTFSAAEAGATVSAATLQDLQLIVRCASTLEMPADVADLTNSVVNGQAANGTFRSLNYAGNVTTSPMGNLHAGASTAQLTELVETWFLGVDEPDAATNKPYSAVTGTLFGSGGPVYTDVEQGTVGDCWLLASAAEVAARDPGYITNMFTYDGTNTVNGATVGVYTVRFYAPVGDGVPHYVTVDTELPAGGGMYDHPVNGVLWAALLEKAYCEASAAGWVETGNGNSNSYNVLNGGWPSYALPAITNLSTAQHSINASADAANFEAGDLVCLCTDSPSSNEIVPDHVYALVGYTPSSSAPFKIYNPWGTDANGNAGYYNGHLVYGLFNATAAFVNSNFSQEGVASAAPGTVGADDLAVLLASSPTGASTRAIGMEALLLALAETSQMGHRHDGLLAV